MTTYKQLQDSWVRSEWVDENVEDFGEDEQVIIPNTVSFGSVTLQDLITNNITKTNYHDIIRIANYIMVINVDPIVDKIVEIFDNVNVVYEFEEFYRLSERLKPLTRDDLWQQIREFQETNMDMFYKYGHSSFWDVSKIEDMNELFVHTEFNGDISRWDVSNVTDMGLMFARSSFNGDISRWDVSNVNCFYSMFYQSSFDGDISQWNVSNAENMECMFEESAFQGDISQWDVSNVKSMIDMFQKSAFNGDISRWDVSKVTHMFNMFKDAAFRGNISQWDVSNVEMIDHRGFRYHRGVVNDRICICA